MDGGAVGDGDGTVLVGRDGLPAGRGDGGCIFSAANDNAAAFIRRNRAGVGVYRAAAGQGHLGAVAGLDSGAVGDIHSAVAVDGYAVIRCDDRHRTVIPRGNGNLFAVVRNLSTVIRDNSFARVDNIRVGIAQSKSFSTGCADSRVVVIVPGIAGVEGVGRAGGQARESRASLPVIRLSLDAGCVAVLQGALSGHTECGKRDAAAGSLDYRRRIGRCLGGLGNSSGDTRGGAYGVPCAVIAVSLNIAHSDTNTLPSISTGIRSRAGHGDFIIVVHEVSAGHGQVDRRICIAVIDLGDLTLHLRRDGLGVQGDRHGGGATGQVTATAVAHGEGLVISDGNALPGCVVGNSERTICDICRSELGIT